MRPPLSSGKTNETFPVYESTVKIYENILFLKALEIV